MLVETSYRHIALHRKVATAYLRNTKRIYRIIPVVVVVAVVVVTSGVVAGSTHFSLAYWVTPGAVWMNWKLSFS